MIKNRYYAHLKRVKQGNPPAKTSALKKRQKQPRGKADDSAESSLKEEDEEEDY